MGLSNRMSTPNVSKQILMLLIIVFTALFFTMIMSLAITHKSTEEQDLILSGFKNHTRGKYLLNERQIHAGKLLKHDVQENLLENVTTLHLDNGLSIRLSGTFEVIGTEMDVTMVDSKSKYSRGGDIFYCINHQCRPTKYD